MSRDELLDKIGEIAAFGMSREQARKGMCCVRCQDPIDDDWTTLDLKEWEISLLCGQCFDRITEDAA